MALRQAVVIIHGIGEQRPMDTLRGFAEALLEPPSAGRPKFWSKPDQLSESFELRTLTTAEAGKRPRTDFYEYYWAYLMEGTGLRHVFAWFRILLFRCPSNVPPRLRYLWGFTWMTLLVAAYFVASGLSKGSLPSPTQSGSFWISGAASLLLGLVHGIVLFYIGDAARYLNPAPGNISVRHEIRKNGIELLRKLHDSGRYDRIIVVGHSLGSVVGYDILKHYWAEVHREYKVKPPAKREALQAIEASVAALGDNPSEAALTEFRNLQRAFWAEQRSFGSPWLISDFVTLGSPLSHALLLLAKDRRDLEARKAERELPTCPPLREPGYDGVPRFTYLWARETHLHHAAFLAPTRWTNLYFRHDIVGGPIRGALGAGVLDIRLVQPWWSVLPTSHTKYWAVGAEETSTPSYIVQLRKALELEAKDWLSPGKPAGASPEGKASDPGEGGSPSSIPGAEKDKEL